MKKFKLKANGTFYAYAIMYAFSELAEHFIKLTEMEETDLFDSGGISIIPIEDDEDVRSKYIERLKECRKERHIEANHMEADDVLCDLLVDLGFSDVVVEYEKVEKCFA